MIAKTAQGTYRVRVKHKDTVVADRTFSRKADAIAWEDTQKRRLLLGDFVDPRLGQEPLRQVADRWLAQRKESVAGKTYQTDESFLRNHLNARTSKLPIASIRTSEIDALLRDASRKIARSSTTRFRATMSALFEWAIREHIVSANPVVASRVPEGTGEEEIDDVYPFNLAELFDVFEEAKERGGKWADLILVLGLTGLRWGELSVLRPRDIQVVPYLAVRVSRSGPDGQAIRNVPKGKKPRAVPIPATLAPIFQVWMEGKAQDDLIFANSAGNRVGNSNWTRSVGWRTINRGRRIHDLRHTAATLWLSSGIAPKTVQTWLGHKSMTLTVDLYSHFMGNDADVAGIARINSVVENRTSQHLDTALPAASFGTASLDGGANERIDRR